MIMIVDDDVGLAETCSMYLEAHGFEVNIASSGIDALSQMNGVPHELVISDYAMPGMNGVQLSDALKSQPATASVPVLLMSGSLRSDIAAGSAYDAFIRKPFLGESLLVAVRKLLDGSHVSPNNT